MYNPKALKKEHYRYYSEDYSSSKLKHLPNISNKSIDETQQSPRSNYLKFLDSIDKLVDSYDQIPVIEFENEDQEDYSESLQETEVNTQTMDSKLSFIINQLKLRIKNYPKAQAAYPSSNRFKVVSGTEEKVGPGTYKTVLQKKLESYEFSNIPRLFTPIAHTMNIIESLYKRRTDFQDSETIKKNKLLARNPQLAKQKFLKNVKNAKKTEKKVKEQRIKLESISQLEKSQKLSEKIRKFEWRMSKEEVDHVRKSWGIYLVVIGMQTGLYLKGQIRRILRIRWGRILKKFCLICKILGKWMILLKSIRKKHIKSTFRSISGAFTLHFTSNITKKQKILEWILEKFRDSPILIQTQAKWIKSIRKLQINWRLAKAVYKARKSALILMWDKLSEDIHKSKLKEKIHRSSTIVKTYMLPIDIKEKFIRKYMKSVLQVYSKERKSYIEVKKILNTKPNILDMQLEEDTSPIEAIKKPVLCLYSQKSKLQHYIEEAIVYQFNLEKKQRHLKYSLEPGMITRSPTRILK